MHEDAYCMHIALNVNVYFAIRRTGNSHYVFV